MEFLPDLLDSGSGMLALPKKSSLVLIYIRDIMQPSACLKRRDRNEPYQ